MKLLFCDLIKSYSVVAPLKTATHNITCFVNNTGNLQIIEMACSDVWCHKLCGQMCNIFQQVLTFCNPVLTQCSAPPETDSSLLLFCESSAITWWYLGITEMFKMFLCNKPSEVWVVKKINKKIIWINLFVYMRDVGLLTCAPRVAQPFCRRLRSPHFANSDHWTAPVSPAINQCYHLVQHPEGREKK